MEQREKILAIENLCKWFPMKHGIADAVSGRKRRFLKAVNNVTLDIYSGENIGLVGESGCGKSTLAKTILRLYKPTSGRLILRGEDITTLSGKALREKRTQMQMVFQDPYSSLNPRMSIYELLAEELTVHHIVPAGQVNDRTAELLETCGLSMDIASRFPGELSGDSGSAWASRGRWRFSRPSSSRTSRCRRWMCPFRRRSSTCWRR
jgi:ABC-type oligopeptide transport system ATPase subunit